MATEVKLPRLGQGMESGTIVKWLKSEGEPVKKREPEREEGRAAAAERAREQDQPSAAAPATNGRIKASPLARRIARERGIELSALRGTGPDGRIVAEDVERAEAQGPAAPAPAAARERQRPGQQRRAPRLQRQCVRRAPYR